MRREMIFAGVFGLGLALSASAAPLLTDDFESYPLGDSAAFDAAWPVQTAGVIKPVITAGPASPNTSQVVSFPANGANNTGRRQHTFADTIPTVAAPITWSFDFYDPVGNTGTASNRQFAELYANNEASANALVQLVAMGVNSTAAAGIPTPGGTAQAANGAKYQARIAFGPAGGGAGWFNLQTNRSVGWHNFKAILDGTKIDFYVDDVLDTSFTNTAAAVGTSVGYQEARIGSGQSSTAGGAFFDNVVVTNEVPEPAALGLFGVAGAILLRRRRRA